jgi:hypothetical protein
MITVGLTIELVLKRFEWIVAYFSMFSPIGKRKPDSERLVWLDEHMEMSSSPSPSWNEADFL